MLMIDIYAGKTAKKELLEQGFRPELFSNVYGASGGPKWFSLFGFDKYFFGEFFKNRTEPLNLIGSSAGAFRFSALSQKDPISAITRLAESYSETVYSKNADAKEVTKKAQEIIDYVLDENGISEVLNNKVMKPHFIVCRSKDITQIDFKIPQLIGYTTSFFLNSLDRKLLKLQYDRVIYGNSNLEIDDPSNFKTEYLKLTSNNFKSALLASGSIPLVMKGIRNIADSPAGMYRDGGIIDYHLDFKIKNDTGLTLYPHFSPILKSGWFDKNLKRSISNHNLDKVVLITPSQRFVDSLPFKKIPDRNDFKKLDDETRIKYWKTVLDKTNYLSDSIDQAIKNECKKSIKDLV